MNDLTRLRVDSATFKVPHVPTKIRKRREQFTMLPMRWYEKLANPVPTGRCTCLMHLLRVEGGGGMSAFGGKADMTRTWCVAFDPKRTCN
jgi:hypothetical protein